MILRDDEQPHWDQIKKEREKIIQAGYPNIEEMVIATINKIKEIKREEERQDTLSWDNANEMEQKRRLWILDHPKIWKWCLEGKGKDWFPPDTDFNRVKLIPPGTAEKESTIELVRELFDAEEINKDVDRNNVDDIPF